MDEEPAHESFRVVPEGEPVDVAGYLIPSEMTVAGITGIDDDVSTGVLLTFSDDTDVARVVLDGGAAEDLVKNITRALAYVHAVRLGRN